MDIRKRNSLLTLILGGSIFLTGLGTFVYSSKQLEKIPYVVERTFELEERNDRNSLLEYKNWGVYLGLIGTIPFSLGLYGTLSYLTTRRKRSNLIRDIPEEDLENKIVLG